MNTSPAATPAFSRRDTLKLLGLLGASAVVGSDPNALAQSSPRAETAAVGTGALSYPFALPPLGYKYDALEPHMDARTMEIHHTKHHQTYVTNANGALEKLPALQGMTAEQLMRGLEQVPESARAIIRNNVGGHLNHTFFWELLTPGGAKDPQGALADGLKATFGDISTFKRQFATAAAGRFGSGWAWLVTKGGKLEITSTPNQDSPLQDGAVPILGLDVWEHAYYLKYQNRRADYVQAFWEVVNWDVATQNLRRSMV